MRYITALTSICFAFLSLPAGHAQHQSLMSDPVLGIVYDPAKIHFEMAPSEIGNLCPMSRGKKFWLFAYLRTAVGEEFFVLSNRETSVSGEGVVISGGKCIEGLPDWILTGNPEYGPRDFRNGHEQLSASAGSIKFTPEVLHSLAVDLLRRYTVAFGGKKNFLHAMRKDGLPPSDKMPILKEEFDKFSYGPSAQ